MLILRAFQLREWYFWIALHATRISRQIIAGDVYVAKNFRTNYSPLLPLVPVTQGCNEGNANLMDEFEKVRSDYEAPPTETIRKIHFYIAYPRHELSSNRNEWLLNVFYYMNISGIRNDECANSSALRCMPRRAMINIRDGGTSLKISGFELGLLFICMWCIKRFAREMKKFDW